MTCNEDDFWNESSSSKLNFFDDCDESTLSETDGFVVAMQEHVILPMHSLISNKCLKMMLDDTDSTIEHVVPPPEEIVKRIFHAENIVINMYHSLGSKLRLLDAALHVNDGNIIITVILFLNKTLNNNIFLTQLSKRKVAVKHYANYLMEKNNLQKLADLYMATGNIYNLKDIYSLFSRDVSNQSVLLKKLEQFNVHHAQNLYCVEDKTEIEENMSFLEFQLQHKMCSRSLIEQLINICKTEWGRRNGDEVICNFKKQFKLDEFQFEWVMMSVLCRTENWDRLISTFTKSSWMIKKRTLKSVIRPEIFVAGIGRYNPPESVIEQFLYCIGDISKSLYLAEKSKIHMFVVNYYTEQRDKTALLKYKEKIELGNPALYAIQSNLSNSETKWKN